MYLCLEYQCPYHSIKCANGIQCVKIDNLLDGFEDCRDGSDEDQEKWKCKKLNIMKEEISKEVFLTRFIPFHQ